MGKPSAYLTGKCECLERVIDFFLSKNGGFCRTVKDKRTVFLSQISFWDWEMDELIYTVTSFGERAKSWESVGSMRESLVQTGILVPQSLLDKIESDRGWHYRQLEGNVVTPPTDSLKIVIDKWNQLIAICEDLLEIGNLYKYRKNNEAFKA